jgi:hypothetical protein
MTFFLSLLFFYSIIPIKNTTFYNVIIMEKLLHQKQLSLKKLLHQKQLSLKKQYHQKHALEAVLKKHDFDKIFTPLKSKVLEILKSPESTNESYVFSGNVIENNPILMASMYELLDKAKIDIHITSLRRYAAQKLLECLTSERPDIVYELL